LPLSSSPAKAGLLFVCRCRSSPIHSLCIGRYFYSGSCISYFCGVSGQWLPSWRLLLLTTTQNRAYDLRFEFEPGDQPARAPGGGKRWTRRNLTSSGSD
jgi:hypothetical protein